MQTMLHLFECPKTIIRTGKHSTNHQGARGTETGVFYNIYVNTMAAYGMILSIARPSATVFIVFLKQIQHNEG